MSLFRIAFKKEFNNFKIYVETFVGTSLSIIDDLKKNLLVEAETQFILTQLLSETIYTKSQLKKNEYFSELFSNIDNHRCVYTIEMIDFTKNPIYKVVYEKISELFAKCTNEETLEIFYLANFENEKQKTMEITKINLEDREKLVEQLIQAIPKQIYAINWENRLNAGFTSSKGLIFVTKSFIVEENASIEEKLVSQSKIFLTVLHEILHKLRLLSNCNNYLNIENKRLLGRYNCEHEIGTFFENFFF